MERLELRMISGVVKDNLHKIIDSVKMELNGPLKQMHAINLRQIDQELLFASVYPVLVLNYGWVLYESIALKHEILVEETERIFQLGKYPDDESCFDRSLNAKIDPPYNKGQKFFKIEIHTRKADKNFNFEQCLIVDSDWNIIPSKFAHLHCPEWNANSMRALEIVAERNDLI